MTTLDFITALFCRVDDRMKDVPKHRQASLYPSEIVTLGILFALKGVGNRAFYRWLARDFRPLFPRLPERTRLFRLLATHQDWTRCFLAEPTVLGVVDSYGIELLHPTREGRSERQIGKKGKSNWRWIIGGKLAFVLNQWGLVTSWTCDTANVHDSTFHPLIAQYVSPATAEQEEPTVDMIVLGDTGFHAKEGDPINLKLCERGTWNVRMLVETVLSMLTSVCHLKKVGHRAWVYFGARLAFVMAAFNLCAAWHGLVPDEEGFIRLSIAEFSL
jgi:hypothetical protein